MRILDIAMKKINPRSAITQTNVTADTILRDNFVLLVMNLTNGSIMITASIAGISISMLKDYWIPIAIISTLGGILSVFYIVIIVKKCFKNDVLENTLASYGMLTGTLSTGLALLREVDPNFESTACMNQVLGSGVAAGIGFPMMILLNVPLVGYLTNNPSYYFYTLAGLIIYEIFLWGYLYLTNRKEKA